MPYKRKQLTKKKTYRRKYKARKRNTNPLTMINRAVGQYIAPRFITKHKYAWYGSVNPSAGTVANQIFRLNSLYDPDYSGTGDQPYGRDQLAGIYNRYRVIGAKVTISFRNRDAITGTAQTVSCRFSPNLITPSSVVQMMEDRGSIWRIVDFAAGTRSFVRFNRYTRMHSIFGVTKTRLMIDDVYSAQADTTPQTSAYLILSAFANNAASGANEVMVMITYYTVWYSPVTVASS